MPTTLFFTDVVGNESVVKGALILVHSLQFRASGLSSTITALSPRTGDCACVRVLFGGGTVGPADGGWLTPRFVKQLMGVLVNERSQMQICSLTAGYRIDFVASDQRCSRTSSELERVMAPLLASPGTSPDKRFHHLNMSRTIILML